MALCKYRIKFCDAQIETLSIQDIQPEFLAEF